MICIDKCHMQVLENEIQFTCTVRVRLPISHAWVPVVGVHVLYDIHKAMLLVHKAFRKTAIGFTGTDTERLGSHYISSTNSCTFN